MEKVFDSTQKIGAIVAKFPKAGQIFKEYRIDFCCGGDRPLSEAIAEQKLNEKELLDKLDQAYDESKKRGEGVTDWTEASYTELLDYIVNKHHAFLQTEMPKISDLVTKILRVHGPNHKELVQLHKLYHTIKMDLDQHLITEEQVLFPMIMDFEDEPSDYNLTKILSVIDDLDKEHTSVGAMLKEIEAITDHFKVPPDGCSTFQLTYRKLEEFVEDLFVHIHLENNILFPRLQTQKHQEA